MQYSRIKIRSCLLFIVLLASTAFSQPVKPHTFSPLDPISSSKINANFDTIYQWGSVASAAIELHKSDTAAHGAAGAVVGTTNTQTLTNKTIGTGSIWNGSAISDAYLNTAYSNAAMSGHRNSIRSADTRSTNYEPDDRDMGLYADFKGNSTDGLSDGATFHGVLTFRPYGLTTDMSGGYPYQLGFTENINVWLRKGTSTTAWSGWYKLFHSGHTIPDGNIDSALARDSEVTSAVSTHAGLTATHGATGAVMGTTNTQTAYSKTLYASADTSYPYWHKNNDGAGSGLDADLLDGYHVSTTAGAVSSIPVRDANGYLYLGWINTTSGSAGTTAPDRIYGSYDGFIRYYTPANFKTVMGLNYGTAAGTVCQGNDSRLSDARTPLAHNQDGSTITSGEIPAARITSRYANYAAPFNTGSGTPRSYQSAGLAVCFVQGAHGWPISYGMLLNIPSYTSSEDGGAMQILVPYSQGYTTGGRFMYRVGCYNNAGWTSWRTIFDDSAVVPLANGGTNASDAATARTNLGLGSAATLSAATAGTASTVAQRDSSGDITTRLFRTTYAEQTTAPATTADIAFRNDTSDNYIRFMDAAAFKAWLINSKIGVVQTSAPASPVDGDIWVE